MSFESHDVANDFPGLYSAQGNNDAEAFSDEEKQSRRKDFAWKKETKKEPKNKGYKMFEEEDSAEELVSEDIRSPTKIKKHGKPSFKFSKRDKFNKPKEKDKEKEEKREKKEKERKEKEEKDKREREERDEREQKEQREKEEKEHKKREQKRKEKEDKFKFKKKKRHAAEIHDGEYNPVFGIPLAVAVARSKCHDGILLPSVFRECIQFIEEFGLTCEGIYRISGVKSKVQVLKEVYNRGGRVYLHKHEPSIVASLLKQFLRELPEPVLTTQLMQKFEHASALKNLMQTVNQFKALISELPPPNRLLLSWMIVHMSHVIAKESQNKMSLQNVSIVLSPTMQISHRVLNVLFTHSPILFRDTVIKKYEPPLDPVSSMWSLLDLPDTSQSALEDELRKQESLLSTLHHQVACGNDPRKEDRLWEVQRVVTQLKRKLKNVKKAQHESRSDEADDQHHSSTTAPGGAGEPSSADSSGGGPPRLRKLSHHKREQMDSVKRKENRSSKDVGGRVTQAVNAAFLEDVVASGSVQDVTWGTVVHDVKVTCDDADDVVTEMTPETAAPTTPENVTQLEDTSSAEVVDPAVYRTLQQTHAALILEEEELLATGDEVRKKIETERDEIERLHEEIADLREIDEAPDSSDDDDDGLSSGSSGDDSLDELQLTAMIARLTLENKRLQTESRDLCEKLRQESEICLNVKVQIRMIQQWQQQSSAPIDTMA